MSSAVVVCHPPQGVSQAVQTLVESGMFDCEECTAQVHIHLLSAAFGMVDIQGRHERGCPLQTVENATRQAGAEGLN